MPSLANRFDAIPVVASTAARDAQYPAPPQNQRVYNLATRAIERFTGSGWTGEFWQILTATATWDPPSVADGAQTSTTVTVTGAVVGQPVAVGFAPAVPAGVLLVGSVTSANTVTATLFNKSGVSVDLASGTLRAAVWAF